MRAPTSTQILAGFVELGVRGATVISSQGLALSALLTFYGLELGGRPSRSETTKARGPRRRVTYLKSRTPQMIWRRTMQTRGKGGTRISAS
jgi:hypothetical protein